MNKVLPMLSLFFLFQTPAPAADNISDAPGQSILSWTEIGNARNSSPLPSLSSTAFFFAGVELTGERAVL